MMLEARTSTNGAGLIYYHGGQFFVGITTTMGNGVDVVQVLNEEGLSYDVLATS